MKMKLHPDYQGPLLRWEMRALWTLIELHEEASSKINAANERIRQWMMLVAEPRVRKRGLSFRRQYAAWKQLV